MLFDKVLFFSGAQSGLVSRVKVYRAELRYPKPIHSPIYEAIFVQKLMKLSHVFIYEGWIQIALQWTKKMALSIYILYFIAFHFNLLSLIDLVVHPPLQARNNRPYIT